MFRFTAPMESTATNREGDQGTRFQTMQSREGIDVD